MHARETGPQTAPIPDISRTYEDYKKLFEEKTGHLLLTRLEKIIIWLNSLKAKFASYQKAKNNFEQWKNLNPRLPQSEQITQLNLEISPEYSKVKKELLAAKKTYYEAIRSAKKIRLEGHERRKVISQIPVWCKHENETPPDMETLLFPDLKFTHTAEDLNNPNSELKLNPLPYLFTLSQMAADIDSRLRTANSKKGNGNNHTPLLVIKNSPDSKADAEINDSSGETDVKGEDKYYDEID